MTGAIRINHFKKEISISKTFERAANNPNSTEYKDLMEVRSNHPDYKITQRTIKKNAKKETYAGLTYDYMRRYILGHTTGEEQIEAISEFDELMLISGCHTRGMRYPTIKKWFLEKYPQIDMLWENTLAEAA